MPRSLTVDYRALAESWPKFSPTELRYIGLYHQGLEMKEIAEILGCSFHTVKEHHRRIMAKVRCVGNMRRICWILLRAGQLSLETVSPRPVAQPLTTTRADIAPRVHFFKSG